MCPNLRQKSECLEVSTIWLSRKRPGTNADNRKLEGTGKVRFIAEFSMVVEVFGFSSEDASERAMDK